MIMYTLDEIGKSVSEIFKTKWSRRKGIVVPESDSLQLGNDAVVLDGAVLYADLKGSTNLVSEYKDYFAAEIYKSFLVTACSVIRRNDGVVTSFDGDRVMAVFIGDYKCSNATKAGLQLFSAVKIINEKLSQQYPLGAYKIDYAAGIDVSNLFVVRTGIRGSNDLAWIGNAANIAAKLSEIRGQAGKTFITERVYSKMNDSSKYASPDKTRNMWRPIAINILGQMVYESDWWWNF